MFIYWYISTFDDQCLGQLGMSRLRLDTPQDDDFAKAADTAAASPTDGLEDGVDPCVATCALRGDLGNLSWNYRNLLKL